MAAASLPPTCQGAQYAKYGETTVKLVEVPLPVPKAGEVLVKVEAASLNQLECKIQAGGFKLIFPLKLPIVPSMDFSGVVAALGDGVTQFAVGDSVVSSSGETVQGALAEYAVGPVASTTKRPLAVSAVDGASIPIAGLTALNILKALGVTLDGSYKGRILILNAAGGVGTFAVQIAKLAGAYVVATAGARSLDLVKSLGADEVFDYKSEEVKTRSFLTEGSFDAILHAAPVDELAKLMAGLKKGAPIAFLDITLMLGLKSVLNNINPFAANKMIIFMLSKKEPADLDLILGWIEQGKLKVIVDSTFPLSQADKAWEKCLKGHAVGKIVVTMS